MLAILEEDKSERIVSILVYFLKTDSLSSSYTVPGERLHMPSQLIITGRIKIIYTLKEELLESKELQNKICFSCLFGTIIRLSALSEKIFPKKIKSTSK